MPRTASGLRIRLVAHTNGHRNDISKVNTLVCKCLQGNIPTLPVIIQHRPWIIVHHNRIPVQGDIHRLDVVTCTAIVEQCQRHNIIHRPVGVKRPRHLGHPCAVVRSHLRRTDPEPDLDKFLAQPELVEDFLRPFEKEIKAAQTTFDQLVFRWCIENYVPLKQFKRGEVHLAFYENFCRSPEPEVDRLFSFLGRDYDQRILKNLGKPSPVSRKTSAIISGGSLIDGWRKQITGEQIQRAVEILSLFGLDSIYSQGSMPNVDGAYRVMEDN